MNKVHNISTLSLQLSMSLWHTAFDILYIYSFLFSFSGILQSMVVWVLDLTVCVYEIV